jgi:LuxR family maltose regulon positive regulatory protein
LKEAANQLHGRLVEAQGRHNTRRVIRILALLSLAYEKQARRQAALDSLQQAVELAVHGDFVRALIELGQPMAVLLGALAQRSVAHDESSAHIRRVLTAFPETGRTIGQKAGMELVESLTPRELEVLGLLARYLSYNEISETLVISPRTVKKHVSNIYQKLGVNRGKQALEKVIELDILPSE